MAINLSALSPLTTAAQTLGNLILVNPNVDQGIQPQVIGTSTQPTPPKFLFNYYGDQDVTLDSDITDHFVEDNTALQDQISLKPALIRGEGFIGELNDIAPSLLAPLKTAAEKLTVISAYTPGLSVTALLAYNTAFQAYQLAAASAGSAVSAWNFATGGSQQQNKQQQAFQLFYGYRAARTLFTVQTPWAIHKNCAIKTLRAIQDRETGVISSFDITFKEINFASSKSIATALNAQGQLANQIQAGQPPVDGGTYAPAAGSSLTDSLGSSSYWSSQLGGG